MLLDWPTLPTLVCHNIDTLTSLDHSIKLRALKFFISFQSFSLIIIFGTWKPFQWFLQNQFLIKFDINRNFVRLHSKIEFLSTRLLNSEFLPRASLNLATSTPSSSQTTPQCSSNFLLSYRSKIICQPYDNVSRTTKMVELMNCYDYKTKELYKRNSPKICYFEINVGK